MTQVRGFMTAIWIALLEIFYRMVSTFPRRLELAFGRVLGIFWFDVIKLRRRVVLDNLALAFPEKPLAWRIRVGRESVVNVCQSTLEYSHMHRGTQAWMEHHMEMEGGQFLSRALEQGKGAFVLTLHMGNGDLSAIELARQGFPVHLVSKDFRDPRLTRYWFSLRQKNGVSILSKEKSSYNILRCIKKNEIVLFVLDQFMGPPVGVRTHFFGHPTGTAAGLALFAHKTGAPVLPGYNLRQGDRFKTIIESPLSFEPKGDSRAEKITALTQAYTDRLEEIIRRDPQQWLWLHRRWKEFRES